MVCPGAAPALAFDRHSSVGRAEAWHPSYFGNYLVQACVTWHFDFYDHIKITVGAFDRDNMRYLCYHVRYVCIGKRLDKHVGTRHALRFVGGLLNRIKDETVSVPFIPTRLV